MSDESVLYESGGGIATITLNRPENRNSMTPDVMSLFRDCVARARADRELRVVVITGRGKSFCAGADFRSAPPGAREKEDPRLPYELSLASYEAFLDVLDLEVPTLAAMNGHAIGGGFGLALVCDLRIANRDAKYGANFARLGFHSGMAISYLLPRLVGIPAAADLLFTGRIFDGAEAERLGLVHAAVAAEDVAREAQRKAEAVAACAPIALRLMKKSLYRGVGWDPRAAAEAEAWAQSATLRTDDAAEGIRALLEKRDPVFRGR